MSKKILGLSFAVVLGLLPLATHAAEKAADTNAAAVAGARAKWDAMTPEQRQQEMEARRAKWQAKHEEDKHAIEMKSKEKWNSLSEEQKAELKAKSKAKWDSLPEDQKATIKENMKQRRQMRKSQ